MKKINEDDIEMKYLINCSPTLIHKNHKYTLVNVHRHNHGKYEYMSVMIPVYVVIDKYGFIAPGDTEDVMNYLKEREDLIWMLAAENS